MTNSPFIIQQNFLSPLVCEDIVDLLNFGPTDLDVDNNPIVNIKHSDQLEAVIFERLEELIPKIEEKYDIEYLGTDKMIFEYYAEKFNGQKPQSENSSYLRGKWLRTKNFDFTGILWLSNYNDKIPFDGEFEVFGGKLEFPQYGFSLNPEQGTLVIFPSVPNFINSMTPISLGDLYQVRIRITAKVPYLHNPKKFQGTYIDWFQEFV